MDWVKMEVKHYRRSFNSKGFRKKLIAIRGSVCELTFQKLDFDELTVEHDLPRSMGGTHDFSNLKLLDKKLRGKKDGIDRKILNQMIRDGYIERVLANTRLLKSQEIILKEYLKQRAEYGWFYPSLHRVAQGSQGIYSRTPHEANRLRFAVHPVHPVQNP